MTADRAFWLFVAFAALVFLMGGGSRFDIESTGPLRAIAALFLAAGLWFQSGEQLRSIAVPLGLLVALAIWMALQLVPLPPSIWQSLAGREDIVAAGQLLGMDGQSRPLTFSPLRTMNSLAALVVPLTALVLLSLLDCQGLRRLRTGVVIVGVTSAILGAAQIILPGSEGLYFYEITNGDSAVGLFSNRNHNALFLSIALIFSLFQSGSKGRRGWDEKTIWIAAARLVLVAGILITSSRFGLGMLGLIGLVYGVHLLLALRRSGKEVTLMQKLAGAGAAVAAAGMIALFALLGRIPALERLSGFYEGGLAEGQRTDTLPYVLQMAADHFPFGVGFGAFEQAYRTIEPETLLNPRYLNHAHNDWVQLVIEGGLPGVLVFLIGALWLLRMAWRAIRARQAAGESLAAPLLGLLTLGAIVLHSAVDYPLRTPSIMLLAAFAIVLVSRAAQDARS
ncbi:O-antigen ligase family protein [Erythrobacter sp. EC-HK427]|uniref:O-antigen ligase family protein n=1 Tax=Erythrobacter sp. EC-HK427 TaxID=2038396 RepID=UPI001254359C|nr:O-antigen ligase family protein [Erythrobacter sp. EC-HK427]VVT14338.1 conserved membrane hypothetical protein [Erythrobacter sp. EC-HK427]